MLPEEIATIDIKHKLKNRHVDKKGPHLIIRRDHFDTFKEVFQRVNSCTCDFIEPGARAKYLTDVIFYECDESDMGRRGFLPRNKTEFTFTYSLR